MHKYFATSIRINNYVHKMHIRIKTNNQKFTSQVILISTECVTAILIAKKFALKGCLIKLSHEIWTLTISTKIIVEKLGRDM